jgi:hypothetical protein
VSLAEDATPNRQTRFVGGIFCRTVPRWHLVTPIRFEITSITIAIFIATAKDSGNDASEDLIDGSMSQ